MATKKKTTPPKSEPSAAVRSALSAFADIAGGLASKLHEEIKPAFVALAEQVRVGARKVAGESLQAGISRGLREARGFLSPALRIASRIDAAIESAARSIAEAENEDYTAMSAETKDRYRRAVINALRGLDRWLLSDEEKE